MFLFLCRIFIIFRSRSVTQVLLKALNFLFFFLKDCVFVKQSRETALKVEFDGDFRIAHCSGCCKRWYFTFNGMECSNPTTIEAIEAIMNGKAAEKTTTYTNTVRSAATVRGLVKGPYAWEWWSEIVRDSRAASTRTLGTNLLHES